jgi:hypothetical protein
MALTKIVIETEIINGDQSVNQLQDLKQNAENSVKSLSDLKKEFKTLQDQLTGLTPGTKEYTEALKRLGAVKDQIGDLRSEIQNFAGTDAKIGAVVKVIGGIASGFQAAQGAMALFGTENEELQKALLRVQAAMALTQGLQGLAGMEDSLTGLNNLLKSSTVGTYLLAAAQKVYNAVMAANPIGLLIAGLTALVGIIALVVNSMEDENEAQKQVIASRERELEVMDSQMSKFKEEADFRRQLAQAQGKSAEEILKQNKALNEQESKQLSDRIQLLRKNIYARIELFKTSNDDEIAELQKKNDEDFKIIAESSKRQRELLRTNVLEQAKFTEDERKKAEERAKEAREKAIRDAEERRKRIEEERKWMLESNREALRRQAEMNKEFEDAQKKKKEEADKIEAERIEAEIQAEQKRLDKQKADRLKAVENYKKSKEQEVQLTIQGLTAIQGLADAFAGKSVESQKRAFQIKKIASIAQATIETYQAAQSAYASQMTIPTPEAPIRAQIAAGLAIASGLARVAVIAKQQFQAPSTGGGGGGGATESNLGSFSQGGGQPPQGLSTQNTVTQLNPDGTVVGQGNREMQPMKAYVVESESRAVTERVNKLSNQSKI